MRSRVDGHWTRQTLSLLLAHDALQLLELRLSQNNAHDGSEAARARRPRLSLRRIRVIRDALSTRRRGPERPTRGRWQSMAPPSVYNRRVAAVGEKDNEKGINTVPVQCSSHSARRSDGSAIGSVKLVGGQWVLVHEIRRGNCTGVGGDDELEVVPEEESGVREALVVTSSGCMGRVLARARRLCRRRSRPSRDVGARATSATLLDAQLQPVGVVFRANLICRLFTQRRLVPVLPLASGGPSFFGGATCPLDSELERATERFLGLA